MTCATFSIKFAKTNQKFAENYEFCEKIHYYCELFTSLLGRAAAVGAARRTGYRPGGACRLAKLADADAGLDAARGGRGIQAVEERGVEPPACCQRKPDHVGRLGETGRGGES